MAKPGLDAHGLPPILRDASTKRGWALCIGAGTSWPAFPTWTTLVQRLVMRDVGDAEGPALAARLSGAFSLDALVRAAQDRLGLDEAGYTDALADVLYADLRRRLGDDWATFSTLLATRSPSDRPLAEWRSLVDAIERELPSLTALGLARLLAEVAESHDAPSAILSFNAEPLLYALVNAFAAIGAPDGRAQIMDKITRATSSRVGGRIPYFFCHGLLPVPGAARRDADGSSVDKLVFSESEYLQLANNAFSWQSSVFIDACLSRSVVFVGVSLSDPNMRRWLAWIQQNRMRELREVHGHTGDSTSHFWFQKRPADRHEQQWIESCVGHLGVRLIWVEEYAEVEGALRALLGRSPYFVTAT